MGVLSLMAKARPGAAYEVMQVMLAQNMNTIKNPSAYMMSLLMKHRVYDVRNLVFACATDARCLQDCKKAASLLASVANST